MKQNTSQDSLSASKQQASRTQPIKRSFLLPALVSSGVRQDVRKDEKSLEPEFLASTPNRATAHLCARQQVTSPASAWGSHLCETDTAVPTAQVHGED